MSARRWLWAACIAHACVLAACGDDAGDPGGGVSTGEGAGQGADVRDGATAGGAGGGQAGGSGANTPDAAPPAIDGAARDGGEQDAAPVELTAPPDSWSCPAALWNDGYCDCGCSGHDLDCTLYSCIEPGCAVDSCDACFSEQGSWMPCAPAPDPADWSCEPERMSDGVCDCGCGVADPDCAGLGCDHPGCRTSACERRHGCGPGITDLGDDCSSVNPEPLTGGAWECPWDNYGAGDGCHCGCGAIDPDCGGLGCSAPARCHAPACMHCADEQGRPYACEAAAAGWDEDIDEASDTNQPSRCNGTRFAAGDGCDCGCGGRDPDCGDEGCDTPGCSDPACDRCTDPNTGEPTGCAPTAWLERGCNPDSYGTGDGCDCGCEVADPDCGSAGSVAAPFDATCDVCHDGTGSYAPCPAWTCMTGAVFRAAQCDCGCGAIDPYCRDQKRTSCTEPGCETAVCEYCNDDGGVRSSCGGAWESDTDGTSSACDREHFGLDGLCDCGCGAPDPDCAPGEGCTERGCIAPGCEVCHDGPLLAACRAWTCELAAFASGDGCDCGCGATDPDCGANAGCVVPGCDQQACETCHDPLGRAVPCR